VFKTDDSWSKMKIRRDISMKCRECGSTGATDKTWGLCKNCYKRWKKMFPYKSKY